MIISLNRQKTKTIQILLVEDEYILAVSLQENLESLGYTVVDIADSAATAIEKANQMRPDLILMDIRLRGEMDGIQAAGQIWNSFQIPFIYITGHSDRNTVERATLTFPFGFVLKPIKDQELYVAIQTALSRYEREQFLNSVLQGIGDGVIVVDVHLRIKYLNQAAELLTGWQLDEAKDRILDEVVQLIDEQTQLRVENPMISALRQKTAVYLGDRTLLIAKDGSQVPIADSAKFLTNDNGEVVGAVMVFQEDKQSRLTQERNFAAGRTRQLENQIAEIQRRNQLKADFLAAISHEMRSPLSNIEMAIYMLEHLLNHQSILSLVPSSISESISCYLKILRYECEQELNLVDNLLNLRILDADVSSLELIPIQAQYWLPNLVESFQEVVQAQQKILTVNVPSNLPPLVSDLAILNRIVSELLNNACKYTPPGEQIAVTVQLTSNTNSIFYEDTQSEISSDSQSLQITISNSGVEIPIQEQSRILDLSYQIPHNEPERNIRKRLGLALVKKLLEHLQGTIQVQSSHGWTNFTVNLPLILSK